jgi:hypothetical protein
MRNDETVLMLPVVASRWKVPEGTDIILQHASSLSLSLLSSLQAGKNSTSEKAKTMDRIKT